MCVSEEDTYYERGCVFGYPVSGTKKGTFGKLRNMAATSEMFKYFL